MMAALLSLVVLFILCLSSYVVVANGNPQMATVRQDSQRLGKLEILSTNDGQVIKQSDASITFSWPSLEMTTDKINDRTFVVAFPDTSNTSVLYEFDKNLHLTQTWPSTPFWFFDLQYAPNQKTLYGIKVVSTYGRVISRFTLTPSDDYVQDEELFALPYMWYVNASSYDEVNDHYFALCNYFPNRPDSVLDQKVTTCDTSIPTADCQVVNISNSAGILQFIGYSSQRSALYFTSFLNGKAVIGVLDNQTGEIKKVLASVPAARLGPLVVEDKSNRLSFYLQSQVNGPWSLHHLGFDDSSVSLVRVFEPKDTFAIFDAAAGL
eukprot:gene8908-9826_t